MADLKARPSHDAPVVEASDPTSTDGAAAVANPAMATRPRVAVTAFPATSGSPAAARAASSVTVPPLRSPSLTVFVRVGSEVARVRFTFVPGELLAARLDSFFVGEAIPAYLTQSIEAAVTSALLDAWVAEDAAAGARALADPAIAFDGLRRWSQVGLIGFGPRPGG